MAILIVAVVFSGCGKNRKSGALEGANFDGDASYALGMDIGEMLAHNQIIPDLDEFMAGIRDVLSGSGTRFNQFEASMIINAAITALMEKMEEEAMAQSAELMQENIKFLEENSRRPGVTATPTGLQYEVLIEGTGPKPTAFNVVRVHYEGTLVNGSVFDSSYSRGIPAEFPLFQVIAGWTEGLQLMNVGSKYRFYIPHELGYGSRGQGPIPPYSVLIFDVELLDIID